MGTSALIFGTEVLKAEGGVNTSRSSIKKTVLLLSKCNCSCSSSISNLS